MPFNSFSRWPRDDLLHAQIECADGVRLTRTMFLPFHDIAMAFETAATFVNYLDDNRLIWPLWLCPWKRRGPPTFHGSPVDHGA